MTEPLLKESPGLYAIDNDAAPGTQWYAVKDPYAALLAPEPKLKRSKTKQEINADIILELLVDFGNAQCAAMRNHDLCHVWYRM